MKTKLRETLINIALNKKEEYFEFIFIITMIIGVLIFIFLFNPTYTPIFLYVSLYTMGLTFFKCLDAIKKNQLILDRNKLVNIIFSNQDFWYYFILLTIIYPILFFISFKTTIFITVVSTFILALLGIFASGYISKYFDKKLKKIEFLH